MAVTSGALLVGDRLFDAQGLIPSGTNITVFGSGSGGTGTYTINNPLTVGATLSGQLMYGACGLGSDVVVKGSTKPVLVEPVVASVVAKLNTAAVVPPFELMLVVDTVGTAVEPVASVLIWTIRSVR